MKSISKIAIIILIGLSPLVNQSQTTKFQFGIEGGPSLSTLRYDLFFYPSKYLEAGWGGAIGLSFKYDINNRLALKTNLTYELKGNTREGDADYRLNYITLPILLQLKFGKAPLFFINIGPYLGYLLPVTSSIKYYYKSIDVGASMGIGLEIPIFQSCGLSFELRNNLGFINISRNATYVDQHGDPVVEIGELYTNTVIAQIGFVYNFGKNEK